MSVKQVIAFLSGKKTYIVAIAAVAYAAGIQFGWWHSSSDPIVVALFGAGGITLRAALTKLLMLLTANPQNAAAPPVVSSAPAKILIALFFLSSFTLSGCASRHKPPATCFVASSFTSFAEQP